MKAISGTKWRLLSALCNKEKSPSDLAKQLDLSVSSVYQHLKELENQKLVKRVGTRKGKTRSYSLYTANKFVHITSLVNGVGVNKFVNLNDKNAAHVLIWSIPQEEYHPYIEKFWYLIRRDLKDVDAIIIYGSVARGTARKDSDIDVFLVTNKNKLQDKYTKVVSVEEKEGKMVVVKAMSKKEIKKNLEKGSKFLRDVVKDGIPIYDPKNVFQVLKGES